MKFKKTKLGAIPSNWEVKPIKEIAETVTDYVANGSFASLAENVTYKNEEDVAILIRLVDYNNRFQGGFVFIDEHAYQFLAKSKLFGDEIIISNVGANVGTVFRCPKLPYKMSLAPNSIMVKFNGNNDFYFHWLRSYNGQQMLKSIVTGSAQPKFNKTNFKEMLVPVPPLEEQNKIAAILSALDEKIAINRAINDNLQQWLLLLYENIVKASSATNKKELSALCTFQEGYVNPAQTHPEYFDGEVKWLRAVDINESFITETSRTLTKAGFESAKKSALLFKPNTIAISKSGTIGRLGIIADYMCGNRAVINIAPNDASMLAFIYCFLKSKQKEFPDMAVGSVQKNLYVSLLEPLTVSIPDDKSLTMFNATGTSILNAVHNNCIENTKLIHLRDALLPRLMSGELDVSTIEL